MALNLSAYSKILKTDYHGPIIDQLENTSAFLGRMERVTVETGGNFYYEPLRTGRTSSIGARNDNADELLPKGSTPKYDSATFEPKALYATMRLTGKVIRASRSPTFAFVKAQVRDMEDTTKDMRKDVNRQLFGLGDAELCQVVSGTSNVVTVTSALYPTKPTKFLDVGMIVDVRVRTTGTIVTNGDSIEITAVNSANGTFTYVGTEFTEATTQAIYREDNAETGEIKEIPGLSAIVDDQDPNDILGTDYSVASTYGGIARATNEFWQGQVINNGGVLRPFALSLIQEGIDDSEVNAGGEISLIETNHAIKRVYGLQMATIKGADVDTMELDGGFKALKVNGVPMTWDVECPDHTIFLIDEDTFKLAVKGPWEWLEDGGGSVITRLPQQDQYEAVLQREMIPVCSKPKSNVKIEDISHN
jgi:hypothetical protein